MVAGTKNGVFQYFYKISFQLLKFVINQVVFLAWKSKFQLKESMRLFCLYPHPSLQDLLLNLRQELFILKAHIN
jgi:hypothetical protein